MSLVVLYLRTRYDICGCNILQYMTISIFLWPLTFICDLQRLSRALQLSIRCTLCCCILIPRVKFVCSIEFDKWAIACRNPKCRHNDVIAHFIFLILKYDQIYKGHSKATYRNLISSDVIELWSSQRIMKKWWILRHSDLDPRQRSHISLVSETVQ